LKLLSNNSTNSEEENDNISSRLASNDSIDDILEDIYEVPFDIENNIIENDAYWTNSEDSFITAENTKGVFKINYSGN